MQPNGAWNEEEIDIKCVFILYSPLSVGWMIATVLTVESQ